MILTTGFLGWLSMLLLPSIGVAAAFVLGAILAPPDTITTVSHGHEIGLPRRPPRSSPARAWSTTRPR